MQLMIIGMTMMVIIIIRIMKTIFMSDNDDQSYLSMLVTFIRWWLISIFWSDFNIVDDKNDDDGGVNEVGGDDDDDGVEEGSYWLSLQRWEVRKFVR